MKTISAEQVRSQYKKMWPFMLPVFCMDQTYVLEELNNIRSIIDKCRRYKKMQFRDQIVDCDDYALSLWAEFGEIWGNTPGYYLPCPLGRTSGFKFKGEIENHTLITFLSDSGIYFFEPQLSELWKASRDKDLIFLVQM